MKAVQDVYCTIPFLENSIKLRKESEPHKIALRIMENLSNIYLDIPQEELMSFVKSHPKIWTLFKRSNKTLRSKLNWKNSLGYENIIDEVCFINPEYFPDFKKIREEKGLLIVASNEDIRLIERMNNKRGYVCIVPKDEQISHFNESYQESWEEALDTCKIEPINSLIISDNYLFSKFESRKESGLYALIKNIVNGTFKVDFHIAIFSYIAEKYKFSVSDAENIIKEIKNLFPGHEDNIKVTVIIHTKKTTTHDREIITNYHRITSGAGFSIIEDEDGAKEVAKGFIEPVFHAISTTLENHFTTKHFHYQALQWLKSIYHRESGAGGGSFIVGDKIHRMLDN